jgi:hypothetical protein
MDINQFLSELLRAQPMDVVRDGFSDRELDEAMRRSLE